MDFIIWIIVGALAGWVASMIMHTDAEQGALMNIILGIVGAFVGGFVMNLFGASGVTGFNLYSILVAILGAVVVIGIGKAFLYRT
jgi:uncharacterized membrane protein YeaQ/YmgE (transglycosylase-associated protein family)